MQMRSPLTTLLTAAGISIAALPARSAAQSACTDVEPGRLVRTGPARSAAVTVEGVSVCMTAEGFGDSLVFHPRDWPARARFVMIETRFARDAVRMESSGVVTTLTRNGRAAPIDSTTPVWRGQALEVAGLYWDLMTMHARRFDIDAELAATLQLKQAILDEMESIRKRSAELGEAMIEQQRKDRDARDGLIKARERVQSLRNSIRRAEAAVRSAKTLDERSGAELRLRNLENQVNGATAALSAAEGRSYAATTRTIQAQIDALNEKPRTDLLKSRLSDLDADARVEWLRSSRADVSEARAIALEQRLAEAAKRLKATLQR
jgi:hypothetical protein